MDFLLSRLFLQKRRGNKRSKNQLWVWGHCNLSKLNGLRLFCTLNRMKSPFPDVFVEFPFLYSIFLYILCFLVLTKICLASSSYKCPPSWSGKLAASNQFKVDIKYKTGLVTRELETRD